MCIDNDDENSFKLYPTYHPIIEGRYEHIRNVSSISVHSIWVTLSRVGRLNGGCHFMLLGLMDRLEAPYMISHGTS